TTLSVSVQGWVTITEAEIFTARRRCSPDSDRSRSPDTTTAAAAPSPVGQHISTVLGQATGSAAMISSRLKAFWYWASGLSVEWAWFFSATRANCSAVTPCRRAYSVEAWEKMPG